MSPCETYISSFGSRKISAHEAPLPIGRKPARLNCRFTARQSKIKRLTQKGVTTPSAFHRN
eukprot:1879766-Lingulodinium_polyedra.AAC.1